MKKYILPLLAVLSLPTLVQAQNNMVTNYNQHWSLLGSRQLPSKLGRDYATVQFSFPLLNLHAYGGSSSIPFSSSSKLTNAEIDKNINRLRPINNIGVGVDWDIFAFSYKVEKEDEEVVTISAMLTDRVGANLLYSKNLMQLLWKGNKQFAGQDVELGPLSVNAFYMREYALGGAMPIKLSENFDLRAGLRLKYLQGYGAVYMPKSELSLYTHPEGRSLDFGLDYQVHTAAQEDAEGNDEFNPASKPAGHGFGTDLGITVDFKERFSGTLSVLDLGFITYKKNTKTYTARSNVHFEGVEVKELFDEPSFEVVENLEDKFEGDETENEKFSMPTSTRILLQGEYLVRAETSGEGREYNRDAVYFTYIQGLRNLPGATTRPFASLGYAHSFGYVANLGLSLGYGGYNSLAVGSFLSLRLGGFRIGAGSSNLTSLIMPNSATGVDFSFNLGFGFGNSRSQKARM